ncbi:pyridoxal phosphate-dependent aminotransferase [uncultured Draconibacterium sp.]|uniref:pyridoxal phosphate-dependent aminotransferase n=1 Tax=uncultured Draconibacterium sp. TaxID=1573823 RepID=UPI00326101D3
MLKLADQFKDGVTSSPIRRIMEMASPDNLVKMGLDPNDVISFAGGWVNHEAPEELRQEYIAIAKDRDLFHKTGAYSPSDGSPELKKALIDFNQQIFGAASKEENIIIGANSTQLAYSLFKVLLNPGDKIALLDPAYANYPEQIEMGVNCQMVCFPVFDEEKWAFVNDEQKLITDFEQFIEKEKPKLLLFSSPDNPTGTMVPDFFVKKALEITLKNDCFVAIDFAYNTFVYTTDQPEYFTYSVADYPNLVKLYSNSKWCRGLGRRLGWLEADENIIQALKVVQQCVVLCPDTIHQLTLANYINKGLKDGSLATYINRINEDYKSAAAFLCECINKYLSPRFTLPQGGLYSVVDVGMNGDEFVENVLKKTGVIFVPGGGFGDSLKNGIRISFGPLVYDKAKIEEGFQRVAKVVKKLSINSGS